MRPSKDEVMSYLKPAPITEEERIGLAQLQLGDFEIYSERLNVILDECREVFIRVANSNWPLAGDLIVGLHTAQGDLVSACLGTYIHSVTAQNPIKWIMRHFYDNPRVGVREGDIFYASEATYGGIHNCDQLALMPIFHEGELIAWASSGTHIAETGGILPGGMIGHAKSRYEEGMSLTPIRIGSNYQLHDDMVEMIVNFISRAPRQQQLDLKARVTAADRLRMRVQQLAQQRGGDFVRGLLRKVLIVAEEGARRRISRWNDGTFRNVCFVGAVGAKPGLWRIVCTAHKKGDHILFDYTGTSPENDSAWNCMPWVMVCYAALHLYSHGFHDLPVSSGTLVPLDFIFPEGTVISPNWDAAISHAPNVGEYNNELLPKIFACMMFNSEDRSQIAAPINGVPGGGGGSSSPFFGASASAGGGGGWARNTMGQGGRVDMDGMDSALFRSAVHAPGNDAEEAEVEQPMLLLWQKHRKDSPGHGKYRGGASGYTANIVFGVPSLKGGTGASTRGRMLVGQGLFGGYPAWHTPGISMRKSNVLELMAQGEKQIPMTTEEVLLGGVVRECPPGPEEPEGLVFEGALLGGAATAGGHGYGDVLEREPQAVVDDVRDQIISDWTARNVYHVAYDADTWLADMEQTAELRRREREARLRRGRPYAEFEAEWLKKKPPEEMLTYYGSWPDARPVRPIIRI